MQCSATWPPNTLLRVGVAQADMKLSEDLDKEFECWVCVNACSRVCVLACVSPRTCSHGNVCVHTDRSRFIALCVHILKFNTSTEANQIPIIKEFNPDLRCL